MRYNSELPRGFDKTLLRKSRTKHGLNNLVQIHHLVPREMKSHPMVILMNYDIEAPYNLILMPTQQGKEEIRTTRLVHQNGHAQYNRFVKYSLDECSYYRDFITLLLCLHHGVRGKCRIPWS